MINFNKLFTYKIISIFVIITFTVTSACYGIDLPKKSHLRAPLTSSIKEGKERFKHALLYEIRNILGNVAKVDKEKDLEFYGETKRAMLLENGKLLLSEKLYDDYVSGDLAREGKAVQVIIHELIEALLQVTKVQDLSRYQSIKEIALNHLVELYRKTTQGKNTYEDEVLANDIWALIFEYRLMGVDPKTIGDANLRDFLLEGYKIINARGDLFGEEFDRLHYAKEKVLEGLGKGIRLSKAGKSTGEEDTELSIAEKRYLTYILQSLASNGIIRKGLNINDRKISVRKMPGTNATVVYLLQIEGVYYILKRSSWPFYNGLIDNQWKVLKHVNPEGKIPNISYPIITGTAPLKTDGRQEQIAYIVTDYFKGQDLFEWIRNEGIMTVSQAVSLGIKLSNLVKYIHERGVIVRELRPGNVMIMQDEEIGLFDFNVSVLPDYNWNEDPLELKKTVRHDYADDGLEYFTRQKERKRPDVKSDIFTIGMDLFYAATGKEYYQGIHREKVGLDLVKDDLLRKIIARAISPRKTRYRNIDELMKDLIETATLVNASKEDLTAISNLQGLTKEQYDLLNKAL